MNSLNLKRNWEEEINLILTNGYERKKKKRVYFQIKKLDYGVQSE